MTAVCFAVSVFVLCDGDRGLILSPLSDLMDGVVGAVFWSR